MNVDIEKLIQDDLAKRTNKKLREKFLRQYYEHPNHCKYCGEIIVVKESESPKEAWRKTFCNSSCAASYNNQGVKRNYAKNIDSNIYNKCANCGIPIPHQNKYCSHKCQLDYEQKEWEKKWFAGEVSGNINPVWTSYSNRVKTYLFRIYDSKCAKCGWGEINPHTGTIPLEVEHIDGNPYNTIPENVTLLCPNCHSLTATYRGANRGNGRGITWTPKPVEVEI